jgi:penicillin amidase
MKKLATLFLALTVAIIVGGQFYISSKLPIREGQLRLAGLSKPTTVVFDQWAIPHIQAESEVDAFRALGFVHAQDRLFQMDVLRRVGKGELAALLGEQGVRVDKLFRTLGTREFSFQHTDYLRQSHPEIVVLLDAYYDGINQAIASLPAPVEYDILGTEPEPFSIVDGMGIFAYVAHSFTGGLSTDPLITALQQKLSPEQFEKLVKRWPTESKHNAQPAEIAMSTLLELADGSEALIDALPFGLVHGSNAWSIAPQRSESGKALIANDPHIAFASPSVWYESQITTNELDVYGHFLAGVPFPLLIRKPQLAQGLTMLTSDDADLIALKYNSDKSEILVGGEWQKVKKRKETLKVKGASDIEFDVELTSLGPVINEVLKVTGSDPIALYWVYTMPENKPMSTIFNMYRAESMQALEDAMSEHWAPGLNLLYADAEGNIAQWAFGRYIKRPTGNNGLVMVDGTKAELLPQGVYPFEHNPRIINPQSGYLFSTNHAFPNSQPETEHLGYYSPVYRAIWADEQLAEGDNWNIEKMQQLQIESANKRSTLTIAVLDKVLDVQGLSELEKQQWESLKSWDGKYFPESIDAAVFERFYYFLLEETFADEMGDELFSRLVSKSIVGNSLYEFIQQPENSWWDDLNTVDSETMTSVFNSAYKRAIGALAQQFGEDVSLWRWQKVASLSHNHPLGKVKPLDALFNVGSFAVSGSRRSLNNMQYKYTSGDIVVTNGPSTRRVIDFADVKNAFTVLPTGQSGNVFDTHYDDQAALYHANGYRTATMLDKGELPENATVLVFAP